MKRITCVIRPHKLEEVKTAIADLGVGGMTVNDVRGCGSGEEVNSRLGGMVIPLPIKSKLMVVVDDDLCDEVVVAILEHAHTGHPGDGKVFIEPIVDSVRVRTGERGTAAL
ncbi:MAG: P-II family nitrogen regulator [Armatimonadetes bacterium]|nr:P-II family nitrogen regulator [Armatimonadota bacterium]